MTEYQNTNMSKTRTLPLFFLIALLAHTGRGFSPALSRYFQVIVGIPLMAFIFIGGVPAVIGYFTYTLPRRGRSTWRLPIIWILGVIVTARVFTNVAAARFTRAIFVQLIALMIPFVVVILSRIFLREQVPRYTLTAILLSSLGAFFILSADFTTVGAASGLTSDDQLGIFLAVLMAIISGFYFVALRHAKEQSVSTHELVTTQSLFVLSTSLPISLWRGEDWSIFLQMSGAQWALLLFFMFFTVLGAGWLQVVAVANIGANAFSSALAWRLLATIALSWFLIGERLETAWQVVGVVIVFATITGYFWLQRTKS